MDTTYASPRFTHVTVALLVLLAFISLAEYMVLSQRPNPFAQPPQLPPLQEGPFNPTRTGIDVTRLPWVLDPIEQWPDELKERRADPCTLWSALEKRYPLWRPSTAQGSARATCRQGGAEALRANGWLQSKGDATSIITWPTDDALVLESARTWQLVITLEDGLLMREKRP